MKKRVPVSREYVLPKIEIRPFRADEEKHHVKRLIAKMPFYREHGYTITLPATGEGYSSEAYVLGLHKLETNIAGIQKVLERFMEWSKAWGFVVKPKYSILLTRYGTGGSYDSGSGRIIMKTDERGRFKRKNPFHTVVHEMVHIGIEESIVKKFTLQHDEKERVVDLLCQKGLRDVLPGYQIQRLGETNIDGFLKGNGLKDPIRAIQKYIKAFSRMKKKMKKT